MHQLLLNNLVELLYLAGEVTALNILRVGEVYEDNKVLIEGMYPLDLNSPTPLPYESIYVGLKLEMNSDTKSNPLRISKMAHQDIPVYRWNKGTTYYRKGRWEKYIHHLVSKYKYEDKAIRKLHQIDIDDSSLFSDIPD